ncbi:MAG TPA: acyltransferase [Azospira sp.]|nr:acyltransferase [Azospira sp.]
MSSGPSRLVFIDVLKAVASQLIVLHHLAFYGPMSDVAQELVPGLIGWLSEYARIAVQVFLVVGGFLAIRALAPQGQLLTRQPVAMLARRYLRLVPPFLVAMGIAIVCAYVARGWMDHDSIPDKPMAKQVLAHAFLLHNILDFDALSAGVWYVAIDFQLFALLVGLLWLGRRGRESVSAMAGGRSRGVHSLGMILVFSLVSASLFHFNRDADWDVWAVYFFGAYGMGVMAYWASERGQSPIWLAIIACVALVALSLDFRLRIAVALSVALALGMARRGGWMERWPQALPGQGLVMFLSRVSYSVFLVHFPICLLVNGAFDRFVPAEPLWNLFGMVLAWTTSIAAGTVFHFYVETREWRLPNLLYSLFRRTA